MDDYDDQRTLLIEDYNGEINYRSFLRLLDIYNADFNTKGNFISANWNYVIITSNISPEQWYPNDIDPWYYGGNQVGPLQRRIDTIIECRGTYPQSTFTWPASEDLITRHPDDMPNQADLAALSEPKVETATNRSETKQETELDDLLDDWKRQDNEQRSYDKFRS